MNGHVIRCLVFNSFIVDYFEHFNKGKHRFILILRQCKLAPLEGRGETGVTKTDSYIKHMKLKLLSRNSRRSYGERIKSNNYIWGTIRKTRFYNVKKIKKLIEPNKINILYRSAPENAE